MDNLPEIAQRMEQERQFINLGDLESLKNRMVHLRDSFHAFLSVANHDLPWPDLLNKFNVLVAKFINIVDELRKPQFQRMIIHPEQILPSEITPEYLPRVLLRTKLIPEIEKKEEELGALFQMDEDEKEALLFDESAGQAAIEDWQRIISEHDQFCKAAETVFEKRRQEYEARIEEVLETL